MALNATIYKANLHIADNDRHYYGSHQLTVAKHPSETDERLMLRLLAFALHANAEDRLALTKGLSSVEEPEIWQKDLTGAIEEWIDLGLPEERRILKACGKSDQVWIYAYGRTQSIWWKAVEAKVAKARNLHVLSIDVQESQDLASLAQRTMELNFNVQDGTVYINSAQGDVAITPVTLRT